VTAREVDDLIRSQIADTAGAQNHGMTLESALISPRKIPVVFRRVENGQVRDEEIQVWLVGQESMDDGYKIILREDGLRFGLASRGFPTDRYPILVGWYGSLLTTFLAM
jgi:hypothetical protein